MSILDKDLFAASVNPDGETYSTYKSVQWLHECTTGKPMSEAEAKGIVAAALERKAERWHKEAERQK